MNIIGIFAPKIIVLLTIWIPRYEITSKLFLTVVWLVKLGIDYEVARPGHSGRIYRICDAFTFETTAIIIAVIQFIPTIIFMIIAFDRKTIVPLIVGGIAVIFYFLEVVTEIKNAVEDKRRRRE